MFYRLDELRAITQWYLRRWISIGVCNLSVFPTSISHPFSFPLWSLSVSISLSVLLCSFSISARILLNIYLRICSFHTPSILREFFFLMSFLQCSFLLFSWGVITVPPEQNLYKHDYISLLLFLYFQIMGIFHITDIFNLSVSFSDWRWRLKEERKYATFYKPT